MLAKKMNVKYRANLLFPVNARNANTQGVKHFVEYVSLLDEVIRYGIAAVSSRARKQVQYV